MKTIIYRKSELLMLALASLSIISFASGDINISSVKESSKAIVEIEVPTQDDVNVSLLDPSGIVIHSDVISKNSEYGKVFDFTKVDDGVYTFVTKTGYITTTKTIELENKSISVLNKEYSYDPIVMFDGDLLKVNFLNKSIEEISISLEDSNKEYFKDQGDNSLTYGKMINIKNLPMGEYTLALTIGDKEYKYRFRI
jgi:hypothetical protein